MKVSFIIPIYNIEKYIVQCVKSVLKSWSGEKEVLLVLGKSEDNSNLICEKLENSYSEIRCILQEGKGLSNARNCGLKTATGDYIVFVDGDDFIVSSAMERRLNILEASSDLVDIMVSDYISVYENGRKVESNQVKSKIFRLNDDYAMKDFLLGKGGISNVWRYIYRRDFLVKNNLWFKENTRSEDILYTVQAILNARYIGIFHEPYYCYRVRRNGALTVEVDYSYIMELLNILKLSMDLIRRNGSIKGEYLITKLQREYFFNLAHIPDIDRKHRRQIYKRYERYCIIIKNSKSWLYRFTYVMIKYGLISPVARSLRFARSIWRKRWHILDIS